MLVSIFLCLFMLLALPSLEAVCITVAAAAFSTEAVL